MTDTEPRDDLAAHTEVNPLNGHLLGICITDKEPYPCTVRRLADDNVALRAEVERLRAALRKTDPAWCSTHQHYKWCEHNGGVMGPTGWERP